MCPIVEIVNKALIRAFDLDHSQPGLFIAFCATSLLTLAACVLFGHLLRRYLPAVYTFSTGERGVAPRSRNAVPAEAPVRSPVAIPA